ncbi:MAG: SpoIIE family protein phosphatase [Mogibacterium sp.]|nr:SpoIIE family protein phosphatase [Mogibacterium sp.]MBQ6501228.1 SpoIIE family protein phosphatase [Mogibacterium sp.]
MSLITLAYAAVTFLLWKAVKDRKLSVGDRIGLGFLYGILSVFSTHFGIDYGDMVLNVRDLAPMAAGLYFDPVSGIIAGLIGGIERYIAGTYFDVGAYTTVACSISTCLAGFFAAFLNKFIFKGEKPSIAYAFFMGAVIEVFHMYVVFVTHRDDMRMAFLVVRTCSVPMILFSGLGLMLCTIAINKKLGKLHSPWVSIPPEEVPVSNRFQTWMFCATVFVLITNFGFNYSMQTASALQEGKLDLASASFDIGNSVAWIHQNGGRTNYYSHFVGTGGTFAVLDENEELIAGTQFDKYFSDDIKELMLTHKNGEYFRAEVMGQKAYCLSRTTEEGFRVFTQIPMNEVFDGRDIQAYETMLADILVFTVIYVLISLLVQNMVVDNLLRVNKSLNKITEGDLNEKVDVYTSSEFASLSDDINLTVDALKGYIDAAKKRIEQELLLAHNIQAAALPKNFTFTRKGFELFATMDPAREVGGDFYDFFFVAADKIALVIADVSDKGVPASLFMMRSKTAIRGLAESGSEPEEIFYRVNNELCEGNELNMFVTVWMGILDLNTGDMRCLNAGHEYPAVMRNNGDYEVFRDKHHLPLGAMKDMKYTGYDMHLDPGDCLYVYTDGIPDAINVNEEEYGLERLLNALNTYKDASMEGLLQGVKADQDAFVGEADQFDDITMLGFRYNGPQDE